ncbi:bifunctional DNA-formamidopyrimidine glycosylase/DNA-(apurinic or apyrimidinic site) lyase [Catenisphaera adipataccumulans]|jgi:formamidopyrimidine-DNA glycosylase|uniref:Formamidopyrimidine-DNA glycosylase n=1 Tax=Catenisphaera adipataccumulans TaxID=700500 RepID=A0A7W8D0D1_9FIRM|nr:bifunctional DNA-formamidopyrimidine glycosylase/DNA-(apurinic or apyrimidinic site) lyase [Catenisphaera adipataccumulans]MBB5183783.1 formamidopyrimidine-DNA glycosylase [Catenisphaera adipataccumulans]
MPEGPEVQVVIRTLQEKLQDALITDVEVFYPKLEEDGHLTDLIGQRIRKFSRLGKYMIFETDDYDWIAHMRMEGKFYVFFSAPEDRRHIHAIFHLDDGRYLCYHDTRKFGRMSVYPKTEDLHSLPMLKNVGYDYTDPHVTGDYLYQEIHHSRRCLKMALLDQRIIAGIGNIYANEICFACGLDPRSRCTRLSKKDCALIVDVTRRILNEADALGGTTVHSFASGFGVTGRFQQHLQVHMQDGKPCPRCGHTIEKIMVQNRGTYLCRNCQKRK